MQSGLQPEASSGNLEKYEKALAVFSRMASHPNGIPAFPENGPIQPPEGVQAPEVEPLRFVPEMKFLTPGRLREYQKPSFSDQPEPLSPTSMNTLRTQKENLGHANPSVAATEPEMKL